MRIFKMMMTAALLVAALALPAKADKLQDILGAGKVRVGVLLDVPPWGFTDDAGQPTGLDVEVANLIASELGVELELVQLTGTNRIPSLLAGQVDLLISAIGATSERAQQVMFSQPYAAVQLGVYGPSSIEATENVADLDGRQIAVARGTTLDLWLTDNASGARISRFEDVPSTLAAYLTGQAEMFAENSAIVVNAKKDHPDADMELKFSIRQSPAHVGVPMGEHNLLQWVNTFVFANRLNGRLPELQKKWFQEEQGDLPAL
ncbi:transporter substrate-binding domain-containing protein [Aquamicrobium sp. LC103]|uniref:transporter substrate-binding domain-containing protein n=1 Tax=Aquamicrobium sp. LC103 TaxID=1120658 RepID=UPI00063EC68B|nr:transporter substrate-binding domain-containing protein [Aquamicrobium sp. LC103]TKT69609.1 transporter substrate-binding domain-containing protein [Aquamicrobium sp. LC103]